MSKKGLDRIKHPRELVILGIVSYLVGFVFSAFHNFEHEYIRGDAFWLGSVALFTGAALWISLNFGFLGAGKMIVRAFFIMVVIGWICASYEILISDLHIGIAVFLSLVLGCIVYAVWLLTWWPTVTIHNEQVSGGNGGERR